MKDFLIWASGLLFGAIAMKIYYEPKRYDPPPIWILSKDLTYDKIVEICGKK